MSNQLLRHEVCLRLRSDFSPVRYLEEKIRKGEFSGEVI